ncbi:MAG TPA: toll/interleukin-1 receptor domain-containing protein [Candidatus Angelobacter sp.]|jgi:hypothetical protein|nr:toll/interleukin-1 receptor domain-containing protein [Candidatus Angelobacter sp.]
MPDVFISSPHEATKDAALLANALEHKGITAWIDRNEISVGDEWEKKIQSALENAHAVVFLIDGWDQSDKLQKEYMTALESYWSGKTRFLVPVLVGAKAEPPNFLRQWKSLRVKNKSDWNRCAVQLAAWLHTPGHFRSEPSKEAKLERDHRLNEIMKALRQWQSTEEDPGRNTLPERKPMAKSSRPGEFRQVGKKKNRPSKTRK